MKTHERHEQDDADLAIAQIPLDDEPIRFDQMLAKSPVMKKVFHRIVLAADSDVPVLILGETGTGKDLVAQSIHRRGRRRNGPFVAVNVGAIPRELVASELFGHERNAFTGAGERRKGKFELARGGTLFLDEVTTMDERTQSSFLRVLESGEYFRVGGDTILTSNVRIIAATNADMARQVQEKKFRADLLYRLDVFTIALPPLRERPGAIGLLCREFLKTYGAAYKLKVTGFDEEALALLESYSWPGNVRELKNVVQRAAIIARRGIVGRAHLPDRLAAQPGAGTAFAFPIGRPLEDLEREYVRRTVEFARGNKAKAARLLHISRKGLYRKLKGR